MSATSISNMDNDKKSDSKKIDIFRIAKSKENKKPEIRVEIVEINSKLKVVSEVVVDDAL